MNGFKRSKVGQIVSLFMPRLWPLREVLGTFVERKLNVSQKLGTLQIKKFER